MSSTDKEPSTAAKPSTSTTTMNTNSGAQVFMGGGGTSSSASSPTTTTTTATPSSARKGSVLIAGRKEIGDFYVGKLLGEGAYARVFIVRAKDTGKDYAMKVMEKKFIVKEGKSKEVQMERRVLSDVSHPNICRLFFSFHDKDRLYMILDLCPYGELARLIRHQRDAQVLGKNRALSEDECRFYLSETISAVQHLHTVGILHRDLKPENVLIASNGHVKLTDFGTAKDLNASKKQTEENGGVSRKDTFCGTAEYVSPEVLQDGEAGIGADLWALGIMMHMCLCGRTPFLSESEFLTFQSILAYAGLQDKEDIALSQEGGGGSPPVIVRKTPESFAFPDGGKTPLSTKALELCKALLNPLPQERIGFKSPEDLRKHSFFNGIDFTQLDKINPPKLPYAVDYEAPSMDGAKQDWLVKDDDGLNLNDLSLDLEEEELMESKRLSTPKSNPSNRASTNKSRLSSKKSSNMSSSSPSSQYADVSTSGLERFLNPDEKVVLDGAVSVTTFGGLVSNRRHMVLTDKGRLVFIDTTTFSVKDEMTAIMAEVTVRSNGKEFDIVTPKRSLRLKDLLGSAERWKEAIEKL
jgi:3-phosphoinositide dependent protein kinase-1